MPKEEQQQNWFLTRNIISKLIAHYKELTEKSLINWPSSLKQIMYLLISPLPNITSKRRKVTRKQTTGIELHNIKYFPTKTTSKDQGQDNPDKNSMI